MLCCKFDVRRLWRFQVFHLPLLRSFSRRWISKPSSTTLQQQLGTGQKSDNYAGLGSQGGIAVSLNAQLAALSSFDSTMTVVGTTINLQQQVLQQVGSVGSSVQTSVAQPSFILDNTGQTSAQQAAASQLDQVLGLLNTRRRQRLPVLRDLAGPAIGQHHRPYSQRQRNAGRPQAGHRRAANRRTREPADFAGWSFPCPRRPAPPYRWPRMPQVRHSGSSSPRSTRRSRERPSRRRPVRRSPIPSTSGRPIPTTAIRSPSHSTCPMARPRRCSCRQPLRGPRAPINSRSAPQAPSTAANLQAALAAGVTQIGQTTLPAASAVAASNNFFDQPADAGQRHPGHRNGAGRWDIRQHSVLVHRRHHSRRP